MVAFFSFLHYLGISFLVGQQPLVGIMSIKSGKDDDALKNFISLLRYIVILMLIGMILAFIGGYGMFTFKHLKMNILLASKLALYVIVAIISFIMFMNVRKLTVAAKENFATIRENPSYKKLGRLSHIAMALILVIFSISVLMYKNTQ